MGWANGAERIWIGTRSRQSVHCNSSWRSRQTATFGGRMDGVEVINWLCIYLRQELHWPTVSYSWIVLVSSQQDRVRNSSNFVFHGWNYKLIHLTFFCDEKSEIPTYLKFHRNSTVKNAFFTCLWKMWKVWVRKMIWNSAEKRWDIMKMLCSMYVFPYDTFLRNVINPLEGQYCGDIYVRHADNCHDITCMTHVLWHADNSHTSSTARVSTWSLSWKFKVPAYHKLYFVYTVYFREDWHDLIICNIYLPTCCCVNWFLQILYNTAASGRYCSRSPGITQYSLW